MVLTLTCVPPKILPPQRVLLTICCPWCTIGSVQEGRNTTSGAESHARLRSMPATVTVEALQT